MFQVSPFSTVNLVARRWLPRAAVAVSCVCMADCAVSQTNSIRPNQTYIGRASCGSATCHGGVTDSQAAWHSSVTVWEARDPHRQAGVRLQETLGRQIIVALTPAAQHDSAQYEQTVRNRCASCHAPELQQELADQSTADQSASNRPTANQLHVSDEWSRLLLAGVSCEACHGAATSWLDAHTRGDFDPLSQQARQLGMLDTKSLAARVENCVRCHIGSRSADASVRDVNHDLLAAGHPRMFFDPLVMESKLPPHWSTRTGAAMSYAKEQAAAIQMQARQVVLDAVVRLKTERRDSTTPLPRPEFSEFDCRACHRPLAGRGGA